MTKLDKKTAMLLAFLGLCAGAERSMAQFRQNDFVISVWEGPALRHDTHDSVKTDALGNQWVDTTNADLTTWNMLSFGLAKSAYFNVLCDAGYWTGDFACSVPTRRAYVEPDYRLWLAKLSGLKSVVLWTLTKYSNGDIICPSDPKGYPEGTPLSFQNVHYDAPWTDSAVNHFHHLDAGRRSALYGYLIADEPASAYALACGGRGSQTVSVNQIINTNRWVKGFNENQANNKLSNVNTIAKYSYFKKDSSYRDTAAYRAKFDSINCPADAAMRPQVIVINPYSIFDRAYAPYSFPDAIPGKAVFVQGCHFYSLNLARSRSFFSPYRPFWVIFFNEQWYDPIDSVGRPGTLVWPDQTESDLRFQVFTALAYGAKGIMYYNFAECLNPTTLGDPACRQYSHGSRSLVGFRNDHSDFDSVPAHWARPKCADSADPASARTKYDVATEINRYVTCIVGPVIMTSNNRGVYHKSIFPYPTGFPLCDSTVRQKAGFAQFLPVTTDSILIDIGDSTAPNNAAMAGVFQDKITTNAYYILVVNKSCLARADGRSAITNLSVTLKGDCRNKVFLAPRAYRYKGNTVFAEPKVKYRSGHSSIVLDTLRGGEGRLIKVTKAGFGGIKAGFRPQGEIAVAQNHIDKKIICFARGIDSAVYARIQDTANVDFWGSGWIRIDSVKIAGNIVCADFGSNSPIWLFSTTARDKLQYSYQKYPRDPARPLVFNPWQTTAATADTISSALALSCFGVSKQHLAVFFRCPKGLCYAYDSSGTGFVQHRIAASGVPFVIGTAIGAGYNPDSGSVDVFITDSSKRLYRGRLYADNTWSSFVNIHQTADGEIALGTNMDNRLEVFVSSGGYVYHSVQKSAGGSSWSGFERLTKDTMSEVPYSGGTVSAARNSSGLLELFARGNDGYLKHARQYRPNEWFSARLTPVGAGSVTSGTTHICIGSNGDGRLAVFSACAGNANIFFTSASTCGFDWQNCLPLTNVSDQDAP